MSPSDAPGTPVLAAGAVLWRETKRGVEILLVYRTQHRDTSLPKGKVDPGETLPETAVRETSVPSGKLHGTIRQKFRLWW